MARIAYGHPGSNRENFLVSWLESRGFSFLAVSYPSDHPVFRESHPEITIKEWAESLAALASEVVLENQLPSQVVVLGWSMAGRAVAALTRAVRDLHLEVKVFVSLSATAPLPGLLPRRAGGEMVTGNGLWDSATRESKFYDGIRVQGLLEGHPILSEEDYALHYRCNNPLNLRGEVDRFEHGKLGVSLKASLEDTIPFSYDAFPPCAAIVPTSSTDAYHAIMDSVTWGFYTLQGLWHAQLRALKFDALPEVSWGSLRELAQNLPQRLTRYVPGGHFFFLGKNGAQMTANSFFELLQEITGLESELTRIQLAPRREAGNESHQNNH